MYAQPWDSRIKTAFAYFGAGNGLMQVSQSDRIPRRRISTLIVVAISLSIGWGVRGNFGHEYGAMLPGVLAALAACILPGREDWRVRAPHFAFFGALGKGQLLYIVFLWC